MSLEYIYVYILILVFVSSSLAFMLACPLSLGPSPRPASVSLPGAHSSKGSSLALQHVGLWAGRAGCDLWMGMGSA